MALEDISIRERVLVLFVPVPIMVVSFEVCGKSKVGISEGKALESIVSQDST